MKKSVVVLFHIGYWMMYLFLVILIFKAFNSTKSVIAGKNLLFILFYSPFGFGAFIPALLGFYASYLFLFKRFLTAKKILQLFTAALAACLTSSILTQFIMYTVFHGKRVNWSVDTCTYMGLFIAFISMVNGAIGLGMKGFITWYNDIKIKTELNRKNYEMELALCESLK